MSAPLAEKTSSRVLEPVDRISEVLFGLIMVLTFTGSLSVADSGRDDVRAMLIGALGCNLAWAIIDALFYLMACFSEKGRDLIAFNAVRDAATPAQARAVILGKLPPLVADAFETAEIDRIGERLRSLPAPPQRTGLDGDDLRGAGGVFLLVFLATFPVAIPFMFIADLFTAMRVSNAIAVLMLFLTGFAYGRHVGRSAWLFGLLMVVLGLIVVTFTIALGG